MKNVWILTKPDGLKDYFTSAKKAYDNCQLWIEVVRKDRISLQSDLLENIKSDGFGNVYNSENHLYKIESRSLR